MNPQDKVHIKQLPTGVRGLDEIMGGGLPEFSFNIIAGTPGCGKTTLAHQIVFANATPERPALYFTILGEPTVREPDGLAMSSRNQYLSAEERQQAATIYQVLSECVAAIRAGNTDFVGLAEDASQRLETAGFVPDYVAIRNADDLTAPESGHPMVALVAARLRKARLIDNLRV